MGTAEKYYNDLIITWGSITMYIAVLPVVYGLFRWRYLNKPLRIYWCFLLVSLILSITEQLFIWSTGQHYEMWKPWLTSLDIDSTNFFRIFYHLNNFALLGWFLVLVFRPAPLSGWVKWLSVALCIVALLNYFFVEGHNVAGGFNSTVSALYCFLLPAVFMWYLYNQQSKVRLTENAYFWISLGLIVPNLLGLFLYFIGEALYKENFSLYAQLFLTKNGIEIIAQGLTAIGFYHARKVKYLPSA